MGILQPDDDYFMGEALREARKAEAEGEIPVGAVVVAGEKVIARAHNQTELLHDVTAHAEMVAFTAAANTLGSKYLPDCTLAELDLIALALREAMDALGGVRSEECGTLVKEFFKKKR